MLNIECNEIKYLLIDTYKKDGTESIVVIASDYYTFVKGCFGYVLSGFQTYTDRFTAVLIDEDNVMHKLNVDKNGVIISYDDE